MKLNVTTKKQKQQEQKTFFEIQYTTIWDDPDIWYTSKEFGINQFKSYVDACKVVREFIKDCIELNQKNYIAEYRIVECTVYKTSEVLKCFPINN